MSFVISPPSEIRACRICVSSLRAFALISVVVAYISPPTGLRSFAAFALPPTAIRTAVLRTCVHLLRICVSSLRAFALISVIWAYISPPAGLRSFAAFARRQQLFALRCFAPAASASHLRFVALRLRTHFCCQNLYKSTGVLRSFAAFARRQQIFVLRRSAPSHSYLLSWLI